MNHPVFAGDSIFWFVYVAFVTKQTIGGESTETIQSDSNKRVYNKTGVIHIQISSMNWSRFVGDYLIVYLMPMLWGDSI